MSNANEQEQVLQKKIKNVLKKEWDPNGIQMIIEAEDEYDSYVPTLYSMLISGKPVNQIFEYLIWLETEHMGLIVDRQRTL